MNSAYAALAVAVLAGSALAAPRETQTFAGPYSTYGFNDALNTTLTANFTGIDAGTAYTPTRLLIVVDMTSVVAATYRSEFGFRVTPPSGGAFSVFASPVAEEYTTITDATVDIPIPAGVGAIGAWQFQLYETFYDGDGSTGDTDASNVRISLQDNAITPPASTNLGTLASADITSSVADYNGVDVKWFKVTLPEEANDTTGRYVDMSTDGSLLAPGESEEANDTMMAVYDSAGIMLAEGDDFAGAEDFFYTSSLSFGAGVAVARTHTDLCYADGFDGDLLAGSYYIALSAYFTDFGAVDFEVTSESISAGGSLTLNVHSNFPGGPAACSPADIGTTGGAPGQDNLLNNNDFIVFIDRFFANAPSADIGTTGGTPGSDGLWNNNDFIVYIDQFFNDQANCTG